MAVSMKDAKPTYLPFKGAKRFILLSGENVALSIVEVDPKIVEPHPVVRHDFEEIIYILEGEVELEYPEVGKKWIMKPGSAKYHPIDTAHTGKFRGEKVLILEVTSPPGHGIKPGYEAGR